METLELVLLQTDPRARRVSSAPLLFPPNSSPSGEEEYSVCKSPDAVVCVVQTTGVELQMKCVNIPESSASVVSAPLLTTHPFPAPPSPR